MREPRQVGAGLAHILQRIETLRELSREAEAADTQARQSSKQEEAAPATGKPAFPPRSPAEGNKGAEDAVAPNPDTTPSPKAQTTRTPARHGLATSPISPPAAKRQPAEEEPPPQPSTRVHPDGRGHLRVSNTLAELRVGKPQPEAAISYYSPELIQCTLPHSDPRTPAWTRKNGNFALIIATGYNEDAEPLGVPYGSFPRLVLSHIISRVVATRQRRIELAGQFGSFLKEVGYLGNHRGNGIKGQRIHQQIDRLFRAQITFQYQEGDAAAGGKRVHQMSVAPDYALWWDYQAPEQGSLFTSWLEISTDFYEAILRAPVPLRSDILKALKKSPLAIDVYMWVSYRLFGMQAAGKDELVISYAALQAQFGTGISDENYRKFRQELRLAFDKVAQFWQPHQGDKERLLLNYEFGEAGLVLYRSPLLVGRGNRRTNHEISENIMTARQFDTQTRQKARLLAGYWSVDYLESQYFTWIEAKGLTPADPKAHFFAFIKRHLKRNGDRP